MKANRSLVFVFYAMTVLMITLPLLETLLTVWPVRLGDVAWRFGAAGLFSRALMTPLLGLTLLTVLALVLAHRKAMMTTAVLALLGALVLVVADVLFVLDALQMRAQVRAEARTAFDLASLLAFFKISTSFVVTAVLALAAWKVARGTRKAARGEPGGAGILVGRGHAPKTVATPTAPSEIKPPAE